MKHCIFRKTLEAGAPEILGRERVEVGAGSMRKAQPRSGVTWKLEGQGLQMTTSTLHFMAGGIPATREKS